MSLALGIGANAAVFSLIDALLFRPFPVERSSELVYVGSGRESDPSGISGPDFEDLRRAQQVFTNFAAHQVARRIPEVGLRMALGAERRDIVRFILRLAMGPALVGTALGLAVSSQLGKTLQSLLIGVDPTDTATLAAGAFVALLAATAASLLPAARAARIEPAAALRSE